jgi:MFS family permease
MVFAAVLLFMTAVALQFHFGQFVEYLGHDVDTLGLLLAAGTIGAMVIRLQVGRWIDRFGCRPTWVVGAIIVALSVGAMQFVHNLQLLVGLRLLATMATASVQTTSTVFAAMIAPPRRRAESLGIMGLAGFMGMMIGPSLGDWFFSGDVTSAGPYHLFFTAVAVCSVLSALVIARVPLQTQGGSLSPAPSAAPPGTIADQLRVIRRYWPGMILGVGVFFSIVGCFQTSFLERLADARGFGRIQFFFLAYCATAIVLRLAFRRVPERIGRRRTVLGGLVVMLIGLLTMIGVTTEVHLLVPGALMGAGHAFVFPSMVDLAATSLPNEHRGTGTALILGAGDVGQLIGFAVLGQIITARGYDTAVVAMTVALALSGLVYAVRCRRPAATPS